MEESINNKKLASVTAYFIFAFILERFYRDPLFEFSLSKIEELQRTSSIGTIKFFSYFTILGKFEGIIPLMMLILNYFSISKSYTIMLIYFICQYISNILKLFYQDPRPYYINTNIVAYSTDADYGNPSGHGFAPTVFYLSLLYFSKESKLMKKIPTLYYSCSVIVVISILMLIYSRFLLGVHALNQLIFGASLGLGVYYLIFFVVDIDSFVEANNFFKNFRGEGKYAVWYSFYSGTILFGIICYSFFKFDNSHIPEAKRMFPDIPQYKLFQNYEFLILLMMFVMVGAHSGILYLMYYLKNRLNFEKIDYQAFNQFDSLLSETNKILRFLLILCITLLSTLPYFLVNSRSSLPIIYLLKICFPCLLLGFSFFGLIPISCIKFNIFSETFLKEISKNIDRPEDQDLHRDNKVVYII